MQADLDFLGVRLLDGGRATFDLGPAMTRIDGRMYGGGAFAAAVAVGEAATGRPALWTTVQFVASGEAGERVDLRTEVLAVGRRVSQYRVDGRIGERLVFTALGACGVPKDGGYAGQFETMPAYLPPEACPPWMSRADVPETMRKAEGYQSVTEFKFAERAEPKLPGGRIALWARMRDRPATPALLGFLADMVPVAVARAGGRAGAGTSLDNTLRFGPRLEPDWVLVDLDPHLAHGHFGHGTVHLWAPDGTLLATGSQTSSMLLFD